MYRLSENTSSRLVSPLLFVVYLFMASHKGHVRDKISCGRTEQVIGRDLIFPSYYVVRWKYQVPSKVSRTLIVSFNQVLSEEIFLGKILKSFNFLVQVD